MFKTWTGSAGGAMPGASSIGSPQAASPKQGTVTGPGGWHPTIIYLGVLIFAEIVTIGWLLRFMGGS
jgi:hypothetical protein